MVRPEEAKWGRYLVTFENDHLEMVGFNAEAHHPYNVYNLLVDNMRLSEISDDPQEAKSYGVDDLINNSQQAAELGL